MWEFPSEMTRNEWKFNDFDKSFLHKPNRRNRCRIARFSLQSQQPFFIFCRVWVARVVAGSRCESIESSMTSCQNGVRRFSWIPNFWTKLRERGLHKRFTIRWKKTVEMHLKTRKSTKNLKKSVLEVDFPILGWFSSDFAWFFVILGDFSGILGGWGLPGRLQEH